MKKLLALLLALVMCFTLFACNDSDRDDDRDDDDEDWEDEDRDDEDEDDDDKSSGGLAQLFPDYDTRDLEDMLNYMETKHQEAKTAIETETDALVAELGEDYNNYDLDRVAKYHAAVYSHVENLWSTLEPVCLDYYKCVAKQGLKDYDVWTDAMDELAEVLDEVYYDIDSLWYDSYDVIYYACDDLFDLASEDGVEEAYAWWDEMFDEYCDAYDAINEMHENAVENLAEIYWVIWDGFNEGEDNVNDILKAAEENQAAGAMPAPGGAEGPAPEAPTESEEMRPEFVNAIDEYVAFYEDYCWVIEMYMADPYDEELEELYEDLTELSAEQDDIYYEWVADARNQAEIDYYIAAEEYLIEIWNEAWSG